MRRRQATLDDVTDLADRFYEQVRSSTVFTRIANNEMSCDELRKYYVNSASVTSILPAADVVAFTVTVCPFLCFTVRTQIFTE